jgi:hypothetical protein
MRHTNERGIALITALLVMMLISALLVGFTTVVISDQRYRFIDKDRGQAFYAAAGGVEKLTADLGNTFIKNVGITNTMVTALTATANQPSISGVTFTASSSPAVLPAGELSALHCYSTAANYPSAGAPAVSRSPVTVGSPGYTITFCANTGNSNNPTTLADAKTIQQGIYAGLYALKSPYQIDVTAKTSTGGETHLTRLMEAVSIPVFQFGIFSDVDQSFHAGDNFGFGGRVHTNGYLYLSEGDGKTLTLSDKVTAYRDIIRSVLPNGNSITTTNHTGTVNMAKAAGSYRALAASEGSLTGGVGSSAWSGWTSLSVSTYASWIRDGAGGAARGTGAKQLTLPIVAQGVGGSNVDILRRPLAGEDTTSILYGERLFTKASIRVLLSDTAADINNIPGIDITAPPLSLEAGTYGGIPIATSPGPFASIATVGAPAPGQGNNQTITVNAVPTDFMPTLTVTDNTGTKTWSIYGCQTKTATQFQNCNIKQLTGAPSSISNNSTVAGFGATAALGATINKPAGGWPITDNSGGPVVLPSAFPFSLSTFWVDDQVVTCTQYTSTTLSGCSVNNGTQNTPAITTAGATQGKVQNFQNTPATVSTIGGYIKIERLNASDSTWHDITPEILGYGIAAPPEYGSCVTTQGQPPLGAALDPSPNAILRLQRLQDDAGNPLNTGCIANSGGGQGSTAAKLRTAQATDYWPNTLFDAREAWARQTAPAGTNIQVQGVMHYVEVDVANLAKWFAGAAPYNVPNGAIAPTGTLSKPDITGYSIYISDRRNNRDAFSRETAEFGFEDFVNPASLTGQPNGQLDAGEDVNANSQLDVYGGVPSCNGVANYTLGNTVPGTPNVQCSVAAAYTNVGGLNPNLTGQPSLILAAELNTNINGVGRATVNRPLFFRRAIKLVRGGAINPTLNGLTIVTENPVYVQGDWNANSANNGFGATPAATSIMGDTITILSSAWDDRASYLNPYNAAGNVGGGRNRSANSWYRFAALSGKGINFPLPPNEPQTDFGSDGGAHNFLRMLEGAPGGDTVNYMGAMASMFYNRQAVGTYKGGIYGVPTRAFQFDQNFLQPTLLPPLTPMFRDMNATGFSQNLQPGK